MNAVAHKTPVHRRNDWLHLPVDQVPDDLKTVLDKLAAFFERHFGLVG